MITANNIFEVAEKLKREGETCEATRRTVINRAYYSAYHKCWQLCDKLDCWNEEKLSSHEKLILSLTSAQDHQIRKQGNRLKQLRANRVKSDYNIEDTLSVSCMRKQLKISKDILKDSEQYIEQQGSNRSRG